MEKHLPALCALSVKSPQQVHVLEPWSSAGVAALEGCEGRPLRFRAFLAPTSLSSCFSFHQDVSRNCSYPNTTTTTTTITTTTTQDPHLCPYVYFTSIFYPQCPLVYPNTKLGTMLEYTPQETVFVNCIFLLLYIPFIPPKRSSGPLSGGSNSPGWPAL